MLGIGADFVGTTDGDLLTLVIGSETVQFDQHLSGSGDGFLGVISDTPFNMLTLAKENPSLSGEAFALAGKHRVSGGCRSERKPSVGPSVGSP